MKSSTKQAVKGMSGQIWAVLAGIVQLTVGVLLLINPTGFTGLIVTAFGVFLLVMGLVNAIRYFRTPVAQAVVRQDLTKALAMFILGGFCLYQFKWITAAMPVMSVVYGAGIIVGGILRSQWSVDMLRLKRQYWFVAALGAVAAYVLGAVVLVNPFATADAMWVCIAVTMVVCAVFDVAAGVLGGKPKPGKAVQVAEPAGAAAVAGGAAAMAAADARANGEDAQEPAVEDAMYEPVDEPAAEPEPQAEPEPEPADETVVEPEPEAAREVATEPETEQPASEPAPAEPANERDA